MGVGLGGSGAGGQIQMDTNSTAMSTTAASVPSIKEEAETSADSLTIDVEGHHDNSTAVNQLKAEIDPAESKAWVNALRTHVVVPLIRYV